MTKKEKVKIMLELLDKHYKYEEKCYLHYETPWQLLIATILSAQCTDERVNQVTPELFRQFPSIEAFAAADLTEMERAVKTTGFYHNKAKNTISAMQMLLTEYSGEMPSDMEKLTRLPGVGRKTANVIRGYVFGIPSIIVDTHVKRISFKLGLTKNTDPAKIEFDLMKLLPKSSWVKYNHQIIAHGRAVCKAPAAKCELCFMAGVCDFYNKNSSLEKLAIDI